MNNMSIKKVLVDNCVDSISMVMQPEMKTNDVSSGVTRKNLPIGGFQRKPTLPPEHDWKQRQIECLPTIARSAREGRLIFYIYDEIRFEAWQRPRSFPHNSLGDIFKGIRFNECNAPVNRSHLFPVEFGRQIQRDDLINFCKWLHHQNLESLAEKPNIQKRFPSEEINNMRQVHRFRTLCRDLSEKQYPDAFHLWTGEVNRLDYLLTTDKKFINAMTETSRIVLPCKPVSPETLLKELHITDRVPLPFEPDQLYTIFGNPI